MKQVLNTLYLTTHECKLGVSNHGVVIDFPDGKKRRVLTREINSIVCFGNTHISTPLVRACVEEGIGVSFLSEYGTFIARLQGAITHSNVLLRQRQFNLLNGDSSERIALTREILKAKILNSREMLLRFRRNHPESDRVLLPAT